MNAFASAFLARDSNSQKTTKQRASLLKPLAVIIALLALAVTATNAQLNSVNTISFQGALTGVSGQPLANGPYNLTFKFYSVSTGGTALGASSVSNVLVTGGLASTVIPVDPVWFAGPTRYLGISVNAGIELTPRVLITAVPYSMATRGIEVNAEGRIGLRRPADPDESVAVNGIVSAGPTLGGFAFRGGYSDGTNYDYNGTPSTFYRLLGGPTSRSGFGVVVSPNDGGSIASPIVWMMNLPDNSFDVRSQRLQGGLPGNVLFSVNASGETQCGTSTQPGQLSVFGDEGKLVFQAQRSGRTMVGVLQITGGADLAEHLSVYDPNPGDEFEVEPGMVVSIDPTGNRKFKLADEPYDRKRVGIISGGNGVKPGLILSDDGNPAVAGDHPIALTGQVWCHADASLGPIAPGDILTTSSTPGHAMKVTDDTKARFAVLGQALTGLNEGKGWVQILVGRQ